MPLTRQRLVILLTLGLFLIVGALLVLGGLSHEYYLIIKDGDTDDVLVKRQVNLGQKITLWYVHSADGTPVTQVFQVKEKGELSLEKEKYEWYGAGLEAGSGDLEYSSKNGEVIVSGYDRSFEVLPIRVANTVPQVLTIGDEEFDLSEITKGGTLLNVEIDSEFSFIGNNRTDSK
ncbi:DUF1850 domain-containing protein [Natranaerofaba carboxydovora]|uniref:DUF1850 domain-containing protein n=1 Tax=Natranaerofaba carboxydovora TaxID=2742683 RepID=UPI001F132663|nr:DUF1850 domain-containing protein [Natranaerofaba carboxydovora]UMZ73610.1 hypothetical protein ACONDI_01172 [Natranaerofaba carboxydovora]